MHFLRHMMIALAAMTLGAVAASAQAPPVTSTEWKAMLAAAKPGDVLELGTREVQFARQGFAPTGNVTIRGGVFKGLVTLDSWKNVTFDGTRFEDLTNQGTHAYLVLAYSPENVTWRNTEFVGSFAAGAYQVNALSVRGGKNLVFQRNTFRENAGFLQFNRTDGVLFEDNDLINVREGIQLPGAQNITLRRNRIGPFVAFGSDHADGIQIFMNGFNLLDTTILATGWVTIEDNIIISGPGFQRRAQCMLFQDEQNWTAKGKPLHDIVVRNNICLGTGWHGISLNAPGIVNATVEGNRLVYMDGGTEDAVRSNWILADKPGTNITVRNNRAPRFILAPTVAANDNVVDIAQPTSAEYAQIVADWDARFRAAAPPVPPVPPVPPANDNAKLLERAEKARLEINATRNAAARALYAIDQLITDLTPPK